MRRFERELLDYIGREHDGIYSTIRETQKLDDDTTSALEKAVESFKKQFRPGKGSDLVAHDEQHEALEDDDVDQEQIVRRR